jgi:XapX domain-containing protein
MLSIIIPCCNERSNVERFALDLFPALEALQIPFEVIVIDDGSSDGTKMALEYLQGSRKLRLLIHPNNRGLGAALKSGFSAAHGEWIVTLDADLTFSPKDIALLLICQKETGADLVSGSPLLCPRNLSQVSWKRHIPSRMINAFYRVSLGIPFSSFTPLFRLYRASALKSVELRSEGFEINAEIAAVFWIKKLKLAEIPSRLSMRTLGQSKLNPARELIRHVYLILRLAKLVRMDEMKLIIMSLLSGAACGALFGFFRLPVPAPPTLAGVCGIFGIFLGYWISVYVRH